MLLLVTRVVAAGDAGGGRGSRGEGRQEGRGRKGETKTRLMPRGGSSSVVKDAGVIVSEAVTLGSDVNQGLYILSIVIPALLEERGLIGD